MEPELKALFQRIVKSISIFVLWMLLNMTFGIFFDFGFVHHSITTGNIIFYVFLISSLAALIWYLLKLWKTETTV